MVERRDDALVLAILGGGKGANGEDRAVDVGDGEVGVEGEGLLLEGHDGRVGVNSSGGHGADGLMVCFAGNEYRPDKKNGGRKYK